MRTDNGIWIPSDVWELDLPPLHRVFLARLIALSKQDGACFAGDDYLAKDLGCTSQYVRKMRKQLEGQGYVVRTGYGSGRRLSVNLTPEEATTGTSNARNKQLQEQATVGATKSNYGSNWKQPQAQLEATTVAHTIEYSKEKNKEENKERVQVVLPFEGDQFKEMWSIWIQERKDRRYKKFTPRGEQSALHDLQEMSGDDEQTAIKIIKQSIAKNWQGLFPLKNNGEQNSWRDRSSKQLDAAKALEWANRKR